MAELSAEDRAALLGMKGCGCCADDAALHFTSDACATDEDGWVDHDYSDECAKSFSITDAVQVLIDRHVTAAVTQALNDAADDAEQIGRVSPSDSEWRDVPPWLRARAT